MASYGDFTSLSELGTALGIGLSLFRAPVDKRLADMRSAIRAELTMLKALKGAFAIEKINDLLSLSVDVSQKEKLSQPALALATYASIGGAFVNACLLANACVNAEVETTAVAAGVYTFFGLIYYAVILVILEAFARIEFADPLRRLNELKGRVHQTSAGDLDPPPKSP